MKIYRIYDFNEEDNCYDLVMTAYRFKIAKEYAKQNIKHGYIVKEEPDDPYLGKVIWSNI